MLIANVLTIDRLARISGKEPGRVPVVDADPLKTSALPTADSYEFFSSWEKKSDWKNDVTVRRYVQTQTDRTEAMGAYQWVYSVELLRGHDPAFQIHRISPTPLLMTVAENDLLTPTDLALEAYSRAREPKQLHIIPGGHFDAYSGPNFEKNASCQTDFLQRTLCS